MTTFERFLNQLMEYENGNYYPLEKVYAIQPSQSTNSSYVLFKNVNGNVFELALGEHETDERQNELYDFYFNSDLDGDEYNDILEEVGLFFYSQNGNDIYYNLKELSTKHYEFCSDDNNFAISIKNK